jgi:hypothetical protein
MKISHRLAAMTLLSLAYACLTAKVASAAILLETAQPGPTPSVISGDGLYTSQWMGARFEVTQRTRITSVGGHLWGAEPGPNTLFAAIVALSGPTGVPFTGTSSDPSVGLPPQTVVAHTVFDLPSYQSSHITLPLTVTVDPGTFALVFGSGLYGATGFGAMPRNNPTNPGPESYFGWWESGFHSWSWNQLFDSALTARFVVEGVAVPEPSGYLLGAVAGLALVSRSRHRH